ncbi:MAG: ATP-binding protein [Steroidobacteraceae bacterium]
MASTASMPLRELLGRTLFRKLFLWFFSVSLGVLLVSVFVTRGLSYRSDTIDDLSERASAAVLAAYSPQDPQALDRVHDEFRDRWRTNVYVEHAGRILGTRPVPVPVLDHVPRFDSSVQRFTLRRGEQLLSMPISMDGDGSYHLVLFQQAAINRPWNLSMWLGVQIALSMLAIAAVCALLARHFSTPLTLTETTVQHIAQGRLQARVPIASSKRSDEFGQLARGVNDMAERIETLVKDRDRLLHDVSHELRSPLARMRILLELARTGTQYDLGTQLLKADNEISRMDHLVDEILSYARSKHDGAPPALALVNLSQLTQTAISSAMVEAEAQGIRIELTCDASCAVNGDAELLNRAIDNLLRNAIRFSKAGDVIQVNVLTQAKQVWLQVIDQGPGVPAEQLTQIFQPFFRIPGAERGKGYGLGLALVQRIAELHGAELQASNGDEKGLQVTMKFAAV